MKNSKNILLTIVALISTQFIQSAEFFNAPAVEIYNKDSKEVVVIIINLDNDEKHSLIVQGGKSVKYDADINSKLRFEFWSTTNKNQALGVFSVRAAGKTKYLSWDPAKKPSLYPQTGTLYGLLGRTKSGLSLKNNVTASDIQQEAAQLSMGQGPTRKAPNRP